MAFRHDRARSGSSCSVTTPFVVSSPRVVAATPGAPIAHCDGRRKSGAVIASPQGELRRWVSGSSRGNYPRNNHPERERTRSTAPTAKPHVSTVDLGSDHLGTNRGSQGGNLAAILRTVLALRRVDGCSMAFSSMAPVMGESDSRPRRSQ